MAKTLTILLLSGYQENEDPVFAVGLAKAVLKAGYGVNLFLYGNACNMANKERSIEGRLRMNESLRAHVDSGKIGERLDELARMGAQIATCHTSEYGRGTEAEEYREGVRWGDVGETFTKFLLTSDVLLALGHS
ncbi:MAG: DsrE family protein [Thermodesulfobacteriota bacterium]